MRLRAWLTSEQRFMCLLIAAVIGACFGWMVAASYAGSDFTAFFGGAQALLHGINPWHNPAFGPDKPFPYYEPVYYPLPTLIFLLPLAWLSVNTAAGVFIGLSAGLLAYAILRTNPTRLPVFLSVSFFIACGSVQWSVMALAAILLPSLDVLWWMKPTYGVMAFVMRPKLRGALIFGAVGLVGLLLVPTWPLDWLRVLANDHMHPWPLTVGAGPLLLLAAFCWRRPEARLLLALALLPHDVYWYSGVLVWCVPRTWKQSVVLLVSGWMAYPFWDRTAGVNSLAATHNALPLVMLSCYLPALGILLWQERATLSALARRFAPPAMRPGSLSQ